MDDRRTYEYDGVVKIDGALPAALVAGVAASIDAYEFAGEMPIGAAFMNRWVHRVGEKRGYRPLSTAVSDLVERCAGLIAGLVDGPLTLLETTVFEKPAGAGEIHWHHDQSYMPFAPGDNVSTWVALDDIGEDDGSIRYLRGSHLQRTMASVDLHTGAVFDGDERPAPPTVETDAEAERLKRGDVIIHNGRTWHASGENRGGKTRRAVAVRFLVGEQRFTPHPGSAPMLVRMASENGLRPGDAVAGAAFWRMG